MSGLTAAQRARLHRRIVEERARSQDRAAALTRDFDDIVTGSADAVRDDEHDPEGATIAFERAQVSALLSETRAHLDALDEAAARLDGPDVNRCERCGASIGFQRLLARPTATRCVDCA